jgi:putative endonuclease
MKLDKRTEKRKLGDIGENIACHFLEKKGFEIIGRNYTKKWGEIDIIARKSGLVHFVEVKSVSSKVSGVTSRDHYRPEDNIHPWKLKRLSRAIQTYLLEKDIMGDWQFDVITVKIDEESRKARVEILGNIVI